MIVIYDGLIRLIIVRCPNLLSVVVFLENMYIEYFFLNFIFGYSVLMFSGLRTGIAKLKVIYSQLCQFRGKGELAGLVPCC